MIEDDFNPKSRPQDDRLDGSTLTFTTLEHGGALPDLMPQAIRVTDPGGRNCIYVPAFKARRGRW